MSLPLNVARKDVTRYNLHANIEKSFEIVNEAI